jgi:hypothetical protein
VEPLAEDIADAVLWAVTWPPHERAVDPPHADRPGRPGTRSIDDRRSARRLTSPVTGRLNASMISPVTLR